MSLAVEKGGKKLDSYDGNYGFYRLCGFEPISYCEGVTDFFPDLWQTGKLWKDLHNIKSEDYNPEDIIFFKYTGNKVPGREPEEFYNKPGVEPAEDYDTAEEIRNDMIKR